MAARWDRASNYLLGAGIIYALLTVYGLFVGKDDEGGANFVPFNTGDNWLHFVLGIGMIALGLIFSPRSGRAARA